MGSLCNSDNKTTQTYAPNPQAASAYADILQRAQGVASQPYTPYGGQMVAGLSGTQQSGISNINAASGIGQPYINQAAGYGAQGAAPVAGLTSEDINKYYSPYQNQVINATMANIGETNAQQQQQLRGNAAMRGALGGDRAGVAQAELARQQGLASNQTLAGLQNQGYQSALGAAQGQQQNQQQNANRAAQGAYTFGNLGTTAQGLALQGAGAQIGAGGLEQQNEQARLNAQYQQFQQAQAFPYQQTGWLAGVTQPAASGLGGTQTTTQPAPNPFSQLLGLGVAGVGAAGSMGWRPFAKDGGRIGYAEGGPTPFNFINDVSGYVPQAAMAAPQRHQFSAPRAPVNPMSGVMQGLSGMRGAFSGRPNGGNPMSLAPPGMDWGASMGGDYMGEPGGSGGELGGMYADGGFIDSVHAIRRGLSRYDDGGPVRGPRRFDDGGFVSPADYVNQGWGEADAATTAGTFDPQGANYLPPGAGTPQGVPMPRMRPQMADEGGLPPEITGSLGQPMMPPDAMAYDGAGQPPGAGYYGGSPETNPNLQPFGAAPQRGSGSPLTEGVSHGLLAAGLGIMAGKSPYGLTNIGQGGLQGMAAMAQYRKEQLERQKNEENIALRKQTASMAAQRLAQQAEQFTKTFGESKRQHDIAAEKPIAVAGSLVDRKGNVIYKSSNGLFDDDTLSDMAGQYLAGDKSVMQNLGRGAQGAENITRLRGEIARQAREAGLKPDQIATKMADFAGRTAAMRSLGTRGANVEYAANTANKAIDLAEEALGKVPRMKFVPFNQLRQLVDSKTSSPEQAAFYTATNTLVNEYARVASGGSNQATEGMRQHAREMLNTAMGPEAYRATLNMMRREIQTAKSAYNETRKEFLEDHSTPKAEPPKITATPGLSAIDRQAMDWANANPSDPRAADIKKRLGGQ